MFIHNIDPVALDLGVVAIYWYGLMWALAFLTVTTIFINISPLDSKRSDHLIVLLTLGIIIGAKLGYLFFYAPFSLWPSTLIARQGLSFHGGLLGFVVTLFLWARGQKQSFLHFSDLLSLAFPWGLFWGRLGNFLNSELFGHPTSVWWAVVFERAELNPLPRHPSQLYEALGEGLLLGLILYFFSSRLKKNGQLSSLFLIFYGVIRFIIEFFRVPDAQLMYRWGLSQGQWLCLAMVIVGLLLSFWIKTDERKK